MHFAVVITISAWFELHFRRRRIAIGQG